MRQGEPPLQVLGGAGERSDGVLPPALRLDPDLILGAGQAVERLLDPLDRGRVGPGRRGAARRRERVADEHREDESGEGEDGEERVHGARVPRRLGRRGSAR